MTKDEFERGYAERSGVTIEWLHEHGQTAALCDCDQEGCMGWQMVSVENAARVGMTRVVNATAPGDESGAGRAQSKMAVLEKSFITGNTEFYFEPHTERWYITLEQAVILSKSLIEFIATNTTAPRNKSD